MRRVVRTVAAIRFALSMRRDLLLEILALRHQLAVLARSNGRFRASDRLLWLILLPVWPQWRDALVLVKPATVDRWHRDGFARWWRRRSRRAGRPRIEAQCRALIRQMAAENQFWGAPRIHGELLKLGIAVSERTVSRYLPQRQRAPSQSWRTFLTNHLGQFPFPSPALSPYAPGADNVVDTPLCAGSAHAVRLRWAEHLSSMRARRFARANVIRMPIVRDHCLDRVAMRHSGGRDPPTQGRSPPIRAGCVADDGSFCIGPFAERRCKTFGLGQRLANQPTVHFYFRRISRRCRQKADTWSAIEPR